jgi:galactokinase
MSPASRRVEVEFRRRYGHPPALVWSAPGRVNLIGEHTDYNDGFVLPFALPHRTAVAAAGTVDRLWTVSSETTGEQVSFGPDELVPGRVPGWAGYVAGIVWVLREHGIDVPGAELAIASDVPVGAGLSSSAALECATLAALLDLSDSIVDNPMAVWPGLAQRAENAYVGMPCGIMDQSAATLCRDGHALFLDCRSLHAEQVPFSLVEAGLAMLVLDTRAPHRHTDSEYAARRATCEAAARALGLPALRDVTDLAAALAALPDEVSRQRVRHVVTEDARVHAVVAMLRQGRPAEIGPLLTASHESLRDDFQVTVPELDVAVTAALAAGALGARMTGGGFGGCVIALVPERSSVDIAAAVAEAFAANGFATPFGFVTTPGPGVSRVE